MIVSLVRFESKLSDDAVQASFEERADRYRNVPGLVEKIYLRFRESGEFGAVYVWDSEKAPMDFRQTELARPSPGIGSTVPVSAPRPPLQEPGRMYGDASSSPDAGGLASGRVNRPRHQRPPVRR